MISRLIRRLAAAGSLAAVVLALPPPAVAATLKPDISVVAAIVTLGDLFDGAGELSSKPVFRAPDPGIEGALAAADAVAAATAAGLVVEPTVLASVRVVRQSQQIDGRVLLDLLTPLIAERLAADVADLEVTFSSEPAGIHADPTSLAPVTLVSLTVTAASGRFLARLAIDIGEGRKEIDVGGLAIETVAVATLARPIGRRELITASDVTTRRVDRRRVQAEAVTTAEEIVGKAARRSLRAGEVLLANDLELPRMVKRGELVTIVFERPGMMLTARGKALADGARGETVPILNEQSRRTIEGVVDGPGRVRISPASTLAAIPGGAPVVQ